MFDRTTVHSHSGPSRVDVHEHRAPTDASVALLREMEGTAEAKIMSSVRLEDAGIDCVIHMSRDFINDERVFVALIRHQGRQLKAEVRARRHETMQSVALKVRDAIAKEIANEFLASFAQSFAQAKF